MRISLPRATALWLLACAMLAACGARSPVAPDISTCPRPPLECLRPARLVLPPLSPADTQADTEADGAALLAWGGINSDRVSCVGRWAARSGLIAPALLAAPPTNAPPSAVGPGG